MRADTNALRTLRELSKIPAVPIKSRTITFRVKGLMEPMAKSRKILGQGKMDRMARFWTAILSDQDPKNLYIRQSRFSRKLWLAPPSFRLVNDRRSFFSPDLFFAEFKLIRLKRNHLFCYSEKAPGIVNSADWRGLNKENCSRWKKHDSFLRCPVGLCNMQQPIRISFTNQLSIQHNYQTKLSKKIKMFLWTLQLVLPIRDDSIPFECRKIAQTGQKTFR